MSITDITFCIRDCANVECERNKENLHYQMKYNRVADFPNCKEWKEIEDA